MGDDLYFEYHFHLSKKDYIIGIYNHYYNQRDNPYSRKFRTMLFKFKFKKFLTKLGIEIVNEYGS